MGFPGGAKLGQMQVAADAAESMTSFEHPGAPTQHHRAIARALDVLGPLPADLDHPAAAAGGPIAIASAGDQRCLPALIDLAGGGSPSR